MLTVDQIMALKPCPDYPRSRVEALWAGREAEEEAERRYPNREWVESPRLAAAEAEVARLRGALGEIARDAVGRCLWCDCLAGHAPACPTSIARAALAGDAPEKGVARG